MIKSTSHRFSFHALDGALAACITIYGMSPGGHSFGNLSRIVTSRMRTVDAIAGLVFIFAWHYCFSVLNLYDKFAMIPSRILATLQGVVIMMVPVVAYYGVFHPRSLRLHALVLTTLVLFLYELIRVAFSVYLLDRMAARDPRRAIIVGSGRRASKAWRAIRTRYQSSISLMGFVDDRDPEEMAPDVAQRYLGELNDLSQLLMKEVVDLILIAMPIKSCYPLMQRAVDIGENAGVQVFYLEDIYATRRQIEDPHKAIFRELAPDQERYLLFLTAKRAVDLVGASLGLIVFSPLLLVLALMVKLTSNGPVLSRQERCGYRRRPFMMLRFRTSPWAPGEGAEKYAEGSISASGFRSGPELTVFGRLLKRTSLDELPELWNVVVGDMSLVGPRPMSSRDISFFDQAALMRRFSVRPGMTGLWQVSGRSEHELDEWIRTENRYIDGWSLALDLRIIARTLGTMIKRSGTIQP